MDYDQRECVPADHDEVSRLRDVQVSQEVSLRDRVSDQRQTSNQGC